MPKKTKDNSDIEFHFDMGCRYAKGQGVEKNLRKAVHYYTLAAGQGHAAAQINLGRCYERGQGVEKNLQKAARLYNLAAEQGDATAQTNLGYCYEMGQGVEKNLREAVRYYTLAAEQEDAIAQTNLGCCYARGLGVEKNLREAVRYYTLAAGQGHAAAQINLGRCYERGQGVEKNLQKAARLYSLAAEQGDATAQYNLGYCYEMGQGVEKNLREAVRYYTLAAEQGDAIAQTKLGRCYEAGQGVEKNLREAVRLYNLAAEQGDEIAQTKLGYCYERGLGVEKNLREAVRLYNLAAEQGDATAQTNLGCCYEAGLGVEKNPQKAARLYKLAAEQKDIVSQYNLAKCYEEGRGIKKNLNLALNYYQDAARQGDQQAEEAVLRLGQRLADNGGVEAQNILGYCYETGQGVEKSLLLAIFYYEVAAKQGDAKAQASLEFCKEEINKDIKEVVKKPESASLPQQSVPSAKTDEMVGKRHEYPVRITLTSAMRFMMQGFLTFFGIVSRKNAKEEALRILSAYHEKAAEEKLQKTRQLLAAARKDGKTQKLLTWELPRQDVSFALVKYNLISAASPEQLLAWLHYMAKDLKNAEEQYYLGRCYETGCRDIKIDEKKAINYYRHAAFQLHPAALQKWIYLLVKTKANNILGKVIHMMYRLAVTDPYLKRRVYAQYNLGLCYETGNGVPRDISKAISWYKRSAAQQNGPAKKKLIHLLTMQAEQESNPEASYELGWRYENGVAVDKNLQKAIHYYQNAVRQKKFEVVQDCMRVLEVLAKEENDKKAQYCLGAYYEIGQFVERNNITAIRWYLAAAKQGYAEAEKGAMRLLRLEADTGNAEAQYELGKCYETGKGVQKNIPEAKRLYKLAMNQRHAAAKKAVIRLIKSAARNGDADAQYEWGRCYEKGIGVKKNKENAKKCYINSANQGNKKALFKLGRYYQQGIAGEKNLEKAMEYYQVAARQNSASAHLELGLIFQARNEQEQAVYHFKSAAGLGNRFTYSYGWCFENGWGIKQDIQEALMWYRFAAKENHTKAKEAIQHLTSPNLRQVSSPVAEVKVSAYSALPPTVRTLFQHFDRNNPGLVRQQSATPAVHRNAFGSSS